MLVLAVAVVAGVALRGLRDAPGQAARKPTGKTAVPTTLGKEPGAATVLLVGDVAGHPKAAAVRSVLQDYFDAINTGDYRLWTRTVTGDRSQQLGQSAWQRQYRSTLDGGIVVHRLEARPDGGLTVLLSFTSVQDPADAPPDTPARCLRWRVSYALEPESGDLRLAPTPPTTSLHTPC